MVTCIQVLASKLSTNAKFQNLQDLNSRTFQRFSSTFKHLICFQALSRALIFYSSHLRPCQIHSDTHIHTHTQPFNPPFVQDYPGKPVPEETFTHSHPSWSPDILYQLPPSTTIHSILLVQYTCLTVLFHNLSGSSLVFLLVWNCLLHTLYIFSHNHYLLFRNTCPHQSSLICCSTRIMSTILNISLNSLLGNLSVTLMPHIHLTIVISARWSATSFSFLTGQVSLPCSILFRTQLLYNFPAIINQWYILTGKQWYQLPEFRSNYANEEWLKENTQQQQIAIATDGPYNLCYRKSAL